MEQSPFAGGRGGGDVAPPRSRFGRSLALFCLATALIGCPSFAAESKQEDPAAKSAATPSDAKDQQDQQAGKEQEAADARQRQRPKRPLSRRPGRPPLEFRGPDVTLIAGEERTIYEYRHNGQLRMIKVVPKFGKPYYLAPRDPTRGFGDLEQADSLIAEWVLWEF